MSKSGQTKIGKYADLGFTVVTPDQGGTAIYLKDQRIYESQRDITPRTAQKYCQKTIAKINAVFSPLTIPLN